MSPEVAKQTREQPEPLQQQQDWIQAWDDVTGRPLKFGLVQAVRHGEFECFKEMDVYTRVLAYDCVKDIGKQFVGVHWVDVNTHDEQTQKHRSRLVAKDGRKSAMLELYAPPPSVGVFSRCHIKHNEF